MTGMPEAVPFLGWEHVPVEAAEEQNVRPVRAAIPAGRRPGAAAMGYLRPTASRAKNKLAPDGPGRPRRG